MAKEERFGPLGKLDLGSVEYENYLDLLDDWRGRKRKTTPNVNAGKELTRHVGGKRKNDGFTDEDDDASDVFNLDSPRKSKAKSGHEKTSIAGTADTAEVMNDLVMYSSHEIMTISGRPTMLLHDYVRAIRAGHLDGCGPPFDDETAVFGNAVMVHNLPPRDPLVRKVKRMTTDTFRDFVQDPEVTAAAEALLEANKVYSLVKTAHNVITAPFSFNIIWRVYALSFD